MKILVVGGLGYIGSALVPQLLPLHNVVVVDESGTGDSSIKGMCTRYQVMTPNFLEQFESVVWLAGHSSVSKAVADPVGALRNNLVDLYEFGRKLREDQIFIYASSASVYNREGLGEATEEDELQPPVNPYDLSKKWFDELAPTLKCRTFGLRFGTVSGPSSNFRSDLIVNAMVRSALRDGNVKIRNGECWRSVLGISDLKNAIISILNEAPQVGIYNVASFSASIEDIGRTVARTIDVPVLFEDGVGTYNFHISTQKLQSKTTWKPKDSLETLIAEIQQLLC